MNFGKNICALFCTFAAIFSIPAYADWGTDIVSSARLLSVCEVGANSYNGELSVVCDGKVIYSELYKSNLIDGKLRTFAGSKLVEAGFHLANCAISKDDSTKCFYSK